MINVPSNETSAQTELPIGISLISRVMRNPQIIGERINEYGGELERLLYNKDACNEVQRTLIKKKRRKEDSDTIQHTEKERAGGRGQAEGNSTPGSAYLGKKTLSTMEKSCKSRSRLGLVDRLVIL